MLVEVLGNIMARIAATYNDRFLSFGIRVGTFELTGVAKTVSFEVLYALDLRERHLTAVTGGLNDMTRVECALFGGTVCLCALKIYGPLPLAAIPACGLEVGLGPYVQFKQLSVSFEPLRKFVLGRKDRPV